jgi:hypothetical protein
MPTFEEQLETKIAEHPSGERINLADLPETIIAKVTKYEYKPDLKGKECLYFTFVTEDSKIFTQKYTQTSWEELKKRIKQAKGFEYLTQNFTMWKKDLVGRMTKPRMYPVVTEEISKKKQK